MAKFKVGDKVKYIGRKHGAPYGKILTVVKEPDGIGRYIVRWDSDHKGFMAVGSEGFATEAELASVNAARSRNAVVQKALNAVAKNGRDSIGILTVGTKVKFPKGGTGEIVKVKKIYSHGFVEPEYTVARPDGGTFIANEGQFEVVNADTSVLRETAVNAARTTNAVVAKALNASHKRRS